MQLKSTMLVAIARDKKGKLWQRFFDEQCRDMAQMYIRSHGGEGEILFIFYDADSNDIKVQPDEAMREGQICQIEDDGLILDNNTGYQYKMTSPHSGLLPSLWYLCTRHVNYLGDKGYRFEQVGHTFGYCERCASEERIMGYVND